MTLQALFGLAAVRSSRGERGKRALSSKCCVLPEGLLTRIDVSVLEIYSREIWGVPE